jgi:hypothetical protein
MLAKRWLEATDFCTVHQREDREDVACLERQPDNRMPAVRWQMFARDKALRFQPVDRPGRRVRFYDQA